MERSSLNSWSMILLPFSCLYGLGVWIRNNLYDNGLIKATGFNIPTISVGNISVGGTGKTPHVEYIVELLKDKHSVATLSRGYMRKTRDFRIASDKSTTGEIGDEPAQLKRRFPEVTVAVDRKRVNGVRELMKQDPSLEAIVLDDAFQHRSIRPGYSILLIDYNQPILNDHLLPAGRLREPASNRNRANMILVTKSPAELKPIEMREYVNRIELGIGQHLFFTTIGYGDLYPVFQDVQPKGADHYRNHASGVVLISGIANPGALREYAGGISDNIREIRFRDHHRYTSKDLDRIRSAVNEIQSGARNNMDGSTAEILILTTEKDAVKLRELAVPEPIRKAMHAVRIRVQFLNDDQEEFEKQINSYVTSNKRGSLLYQGED